MSRRHSVAEAEISACPEYDLIDRKKIAFLEVKCICRNRTYDYYRGPSKCAEKRVMAVPISARLVPQVQRLPPHELDHGSKLVNTQSMKGPITDAHTQTVG